MGIMYCHGPWWTHEGDGLVADPCGKAFLSCTQIDMIQQAFAHDLHASRLADYLGFCVLGICKAYTE